MKNEESSHGPIFDENFFLAENWPNVVKIALFGVFKKIVSLYLVGNALKWSVLMVGNFSRKPHVQEKSRSWDMARKALGQSDRSILESILSCRSFMLKIWKNPQKSDKLVSTTSRKPFVQKRSGSHVFALLTILCFSRARTWFRYWCIVP